jgi:hypothetical protein|tara:strand:+ start:74 stop:544 length:471 start_codon:yes stop_codon:yes gene_type:complete
MTDLEAKVWKYLLGNRKATVKEVATALDVKPKPVKDIMSRISSPNWREGGVPKDAFVKSDDSKSRYDLLPPELLEETAQVLTFGAQKYSAHNWAQGASWSRYFSAMMRHMWAWWRGEDNDPETGYSHLAHAACCLGFLMAYQRRSIGKDDRLKGGV